MSAIELADGTVTIVFEEDDDGSSTICAMLSTSRLADEYMEVAKKNRPGIKQYKLSWQVHTSLDSFHDHDEDEG